MVPLASAAGLLAGDRLSELTEKAISLVNSGKSKQLLQMPGWWYVISAESFLDMLSNCPDILELAPQIACPVLYLRGDREPRDLYPAEEFKRRSSGPCSVDIVPDCDHFYRGREDEVAKRVNMFIKTAVRVDTR